MKKLLIVLSVLGIGFSLSACKEKEEKEIPVVIEEIDFDLMYPKSGVYYQIFVRSFADSDNDGIGDFNGITAKLEYLNDLGIDSLWLMPIHPSPTYHGYDVLDYYGVNSEYGTMADFDNMVAEADKLGINIIIDLVINHTSSSHEWFTKWMAGDPDYAGYYRKILNTDSRFEDHRSLWHSMGENEYYAGYFGGGMPDLNWSNPKVQEEMLDVALFWMEKGVDGFRLDAALHLEGYGEVKPPTVAIDSTLNKLELFEYQIAETYPDVYIVGEIWDSFSSFSKFYRSMDSALNFDTGNSILRAINTGYSTDYVSDLVRDYQTIEDIREDGLDAPFLKNHDQDRLASIVNGDMAKLKLAAEMLLTLEGNPYMYYGEELGMFGIKSSGPYWDETRRLPYLFDDEYVTTWFADDFNGSVDRVTDQLANPESLLNTYKTLLNVRQDSLALKFGDLLPYEYTDNVLQGYYRVFNYDDDHQEIVLVLHNLANAGYDIDIDGEVIYYSDGLEAFNNTVGAQSTVIIRLSNDVIETLGTE